MEQSSFLSSLAFLLPLRSKASSAWPGGAKSAKSLLNDEFDSFVVAIELLPPKDDASKPPRPLFFADQTDPTLSPVQLLMTAPTVSVVSSTPSSSQSSSQDRDRGRRYREEDRRGGAAVKHKHVYLKIADHMSLVDAASARKIEVQSEVYHRHDEQLQQAKNRDDHSTNATDATPHHKPPRRSVRLPPCLVIQFSVCQFRIFRNRTDHILADKEALAAACKALTKARFAPFTLPLDAIASSPARTSYSSNSNGHRHGSSSSSSGTITATTTTTTAMLGEDDDKKNRHIPDAVVDDDDNNDDDNNRKRSAASANMDDADNDRSVDGSTTTTRGRIQRCQKNRADFLTRLDMIANVLRHVPDDGTGTGAPTTLLLTRAADSCAASYISSHEVEAMQYERTAEFDNQEAMDAVLADFFPDRNSMSHPNSQQTNNVQDSIKKIKELLEERKKLIKEHDDILLLPIRG